MSGDTYKLVAALVGFISFLAVWIYAMSTWGLLLGLMFGWVPAGIAGFIIGFTWPLWALLVGYLFIVYMNAHG